jgi:hypothetical protein
MKCIADFSFERTLGRVAVDATRQELDLERFSAERVRVVAMAERCTTFTADAQRLHPTFWGEWFLRSKQQE